MINMSTKRWLPMTQLSPVVIGLSCYQGRWLIALMLIFGCDPVPFLMGEPSELHISSKMKRCSVGPQNDGTRLFVNKL